MIKDFKSALMLNAKNIYGWRTNRKIVVISVDDYGNVRLDSKKAHENMVRAGLKMKGPFNNFDTLETREDIELLYEALTSVKDINNRHAVFTPFALPCNIDFEKMAEDKYRQYYYELLPQTYEKLAASQPKAYAGTWDLWEQGIREKIMMPQFHGREHFNLKIFEEKLAKNDIEVLTALRNRSYSGISNSGYSTIKPMAAFDFYDFVENERFSEIIKDGLDAFEKVYGYHSTHFNPPGGREHPCIHKVLKENGISYLDTPWVKYEHQGNEKYKRIINYTGKKNHLGMIYMVRNVVFEPTQDRGVDWVSYTMKQIEAAFRWNRPAVISSHRVNFCGHIDANNRTIGIIALRELLQKVVKKWPDVEFMAANELGDLIASK